MLLRNIFCSLLCFVVNTCIWERMYILGHRLSIVIWVYFKPGNIDLVRITNYIRIFCMSHCVSYMYKCTGKLPFPSSFRFWNSFLSIDPNCISNLCIGCFWTVSHLGLFTNTCHVGPPYLNMWLFINSCCCQLFLLSTGTPGMKERPGTPTPSTMRRSGSMVYWPSQGRQLLSSPFLALT